VWSLYKKFDVEAIEKVQKRGTKLVISLKIIIYSLGLPTLKYRRLLGDMRFLNINMIIKLHLN